MRTKLITEQEFCTEVAVGGFLGAYRFWRTIMDSGQDAAGMREHGEGILRAMAVLVFEARKGRAASPQESEAWLYCGLVAKNGNEL